MRANHENIQVHAAGATHSSWPETSRPARPGEAHRACRLLVTGQGERGQQALAGALLKLLGGCPCAVLGLPQLMAAAGGDPAAGWLSLLSAKSGR